MDADRTGVARAGWKLPALGGPAVLAGWRPQYTADALVLAALHDPRCQECSDYAAQLEAVRPELEVWGGRLLVVRGPGAVPAALGEAPRTVVADRFGEIYFAADGGGRHALPEPRVLEEWLRFIALRCPE